MFHMYNFFNEDYARQWLIENGICAPEGETCKKCGDGVYHRYPSETTLRCTACRSRRSIFADTFFRETEIANRPCNNHGIFMGSRSESASNGNHDWLFARNRVPVQEAFRRTRELHGSGREAKNWWSRNNRRNGRIVIWPPQVQSGSQGGISMGCWWG